jgi:DNA-binding transcriptional LysR family regulator
MELRQLKYFQTVSHLGSVTRAAEKCHVAQPAISIAIQKLEEELGVQLFDRYQKRIVLTAVGHIFLRRVDDILERVNNSVKEMDDYRKLQRGAIRIGIPPMLGAFLFPYIFSRFQKDHPDIELSVIEEGTLTIKALLEHGELDVGIIMVSDISPSLETAPIIRSEICVCLHQNHPLSSLSKIPFEKLSGQQFILLKEDTYARQLVLEECARCDFTPSIAFSSNQIETALRLVEQEVGITFLLGPLASKNLSIVSRPLQNPLYVQAGLAWSKKRYLSSATQAFIDGIKNSPLQL